MKKQLLHYPTNPLKEGEEWEVPLNIKSNETGELSCELLNLTGFISRSYAKPGRTCSSHRGWEGGPMCAVTWNRRYLRASDFELQAVRVKLRSVEQLELDLHL